MAIHYFQNQNTYPVVISVQYQNVQLVVPPGDSVQGDNSVGMPLAQAVLNGALVDTTTLAGGSTCIFIEETAQQAGGTSGYSGYSGKSGWSGFSGATAASGYSGSNGASGYSGFSGATPATYVTSIDGLSGVVGVSGSGVSIAKSGQVIWVTVP